MARNQAGGYKAASPTGGYYGGDVGRHHWKLPLFQAGVAAYRKARADYWTVKAFEGGTPIPSSSFKASNRCEWCGDKIAHGITCCAKVDCYKASPMRHRTA